MQKVYGLQDLNYIAKMWKLPGVDHIAPELIEVGMGGNITFFDT
jgi:hypothetical protein